jgi:DNA-binding HxlR family transcriptional regulator
MEKNLVEYSCPSDVFMKVLKGKCKTTLLVLIKKEVNRFGEMKRALPTISERMLAKQLDELEADGILSRTVFAEVPPRVEYALTEYGETIYPIVKEIRKWGRIHQEKLYKICNFFNPTDIPLSLSSSYFVMSSR